jgi:hypothetical protein
MNDTLLLRNLLDKSFTGEKRAGSNIFKAK